MPAAVASDLAFGQLLAQLQAAAGAAAGGSSGGSSDGGGALSRLKLLNRLGKGQRTKGNSPASTVTSAKRAPADGGRSGGGGVKGAAAAAAPRAAPFYGRVEQDRLTQQWVLRGMESELTALAERLPALQARLRAAVKAEQEEQERELRRLYASGSLERLRSDGVLLYPLRAAPQSVELGQMIWRLALPGQGRDLPQHKFKVGGVIWGVIWGV